jgi:hypothetical protein
MCIPLIMRNSRKLRGSLRRTKVKNPNPTCCKKINAKTRILVQVTEENINVFKALQPLSCTPFEIGDYVTHDEFTDRQLFDKNLKPKTFENPDYEYFLSDDKTEILEVRVKNKPHHYRIIKTDDDLKTAKMFDLNAKLKYVIVEDSEYGGQSIISPADFEKYYTIVE